MMAFDTADKILYDLQISVVRLDKRLLALEKQLKLLTTNPVVELGEKIGTRILNDGMEKENDPPA